MEKKKNKKAKRQEQGPRRPSAEQQGLWKRVTIDGWTQEAAGKEFGVSQSYASRIVRAVDEWMVKERPAGGGHWTPVQILSHANQVAGIRYEEQLQQSKANYEQSKQKTITIKEKDFIDFVEIEQAAEAAQEPREKPRQEKILRRTRETTTKEVPQGDFRFLNQQLKLTKEIRDVQVAMSQLPPLPPKPEKGKPRPLTKAEWDLQQKCMRNWHNALIDLEIARTGIPLFKLYPTQQVDLSWYDRPVGDACTPGYIDPESEEGLEMLRKRWEKDRSRFEQPVSGGNSEGLGGEGDAPKAGEIIPLTERFYLQDDEPFEYPSSPSPLLTPDKDPYYAVRQISPGVTFRPHTPEEIRARAEWRRQQDALCR